MHEGEGSGKNSMNPIFTLSPFPQAKHIQHPHPVWPWRIDVGLIGLIPLNHRRTDDISDPESREAVTESKLRPP